MKKTIWDIKKGDKYWFVDAIGYINHVTWIDDIDDALRRSCFNAFLNYNEAKAELNARKKKAQTLKPILDDAERRYLKAVIRPFRDKVKYICKRSRLSGKAEYIIIALDDDYTYLPCFKTDTMYQGMELDRKYTLEELGL